MNQMDKLKDTMELKARAKQRQKIALPAAVVVFIAVMVLLSQHREWGALHEYALLPAVLVGCAVYFAVMVVGMKRL